MMPTYTLAQWALRWGIPAAALTDLTSLLTVDPPPTPAGHKESHVLPHVRLTASESGWRLFRNNVGACHTDTGGFFRYGLANESVRMNAQVKSSDLIGIRPVTLTQEHVGQTLGQFVALECKKPGWVFRGSPTELAQRRFLTLVEFYGGYGRFTTGGVE